MKPVTSCQAPLEWDALIAYWLGETDSEAEAMIEEHYLGCAHCSQRLETLVALAQEVRELTRTSGVNMVITDSFVQHLREQGVQVREYHVPRNGSVNCTVAPGDDLVVGHLEAPLDKVRRLDLVCVDREGKDQVRLEDIPFKPESGGVVFSTRMETLRTLPACTLRVHLFEVDDHGERLLGEYTLRHSPQTLQDHE